MDDKMKLSRKQVFIDRNFQLRFILQFCLLILAGLVLFNIAAYFILDRQLGKTLFSAHLALTRTGDLLLPTLTAISAVFVVILGAAAAGITLLVSHRICGPLFAIVRYLKMIGEGKLNFEARLRTNDQTAVVADTLTETVRALRGKVLAPDGATARLTHELHEHVRILETRLASFETE
jgi:hypothetical protein